MLWVCEPLIKYDYFGRIYMYYVVMHLPEESAAPMGRSTTSAALLGSKSKFEMSRRTFRRTPVRGRLESLASRPFDGSVEARATARLLHPASSSRALDLDALSSIAQGLAHSALQATGGLERDGGRAYRRLLRTEAFEAWLISWDEGSFLGLHDHGSSSGAFTVVAGALVEFASDLVIGGAMRRRQLSVGSVRCFDATVAHEVWNPQRSSALSVHVYSPPLTTMGFYQAGQGGPLDRRTVVACQGPGD
jgi:hypothetical protein